MYKCQVVYNGSGMQDRINCAIEIVNNEHGVITSTSANDGCTFIFYEVPSEGI
jgi:hypothetical protein